MKKILLINDHDINGGAESVFHLQYDCFKDKYQVDKLIGEHFIKRNFFNYIYSKRVEKYILDLVLSKQYDIVHIHNYYHFFSPSLLNGLTKAKKQLKNLKVVYTAHDFHLVCPNSGCFYYKNNKLKNFTINDGIAEYIWRKIDNRSVLHNFLKKAQWINAYVFHKYHTAIDHITTPSFFLKSFISAKHQIPVSVIRNPVDAPIQHNHTKTYMQDGILKIVFFGRLAVEKGVFEFITLLSSVKNINFSFTIFGDGPEKQRIEKQIIASGLNDKIVLKGAVMRNDLLPQLSNFDLFILPSLWYENAPMSIVEAANSNLLVATSNWGGMTELVAATGGGFHFLPGDINSLQRCLTDVITYIRSGKAISGQPIKEDFSKENFYNKFNQLYELL